MADPNAPSLLNPFDELDPDKNKGAAVPKAAAPPKQPSNDNPFNKDDPFSGEEIATPDVSKVGTLARTAARSALPALTGFAGAGAGAEIGAAGGALVGAAFPPALPFTTIGGAIVGGVAGMFGASWATEKAQDWGIKQLPDSWQENLGQSDRQQKLDEMVNPKTAFIGGLLPYAMTMRPGGWGKKAVPPNATALQRIMANPVTEHAFSGAVMGGFELGQEAAHGDVDWAKVGIATGFGVVFNKPTKFGERISGTGAAAVGPLRFGVESFTAGRAERRARAEVEKAGGEYSYEDVPNFGGVRDLTLAQTNDIGVMGPGATEETFFGSHARNPDAEATAREGAQAEATFFGHDGNAPDLHTLARQSHPEVFAQQEDLLKRQATYKRWLDELDVTRAENAKPGIEAQQAKVDAILEKVKGVEDRLTKKQAADLAAARADLEAAKAHGGDTPDMAVVRRRLLETTHALWDLAPDVRAAYRRTAERHGIEMVEPIDQNGVSRQNVAHAEARTVQEEAARNVHGLPSGAPGAQATVVPEVPRGLHADVAQKPSPEGRGEGQGQRAELREHLPAQGPAGAGTVPEMRVAGGAEAPSGLSPAAAGGVDVRGLPSGAPRFRTEQRAAIVSDVYRQLTEAGRPAEEARAAAELIASRYETRAARFKGVLGTAEELYRREGPQVTGAPEGAPASEEEAALAQSRGRELGRITTGGLRAEIALARDADASTFLHESAHDFLEQLGRDAKHEQAPEDVKADAAAIRRWLGTKGEEPTKRQHEKFATGFEQYMREGVAPSRELAGVFAKFRDWLTEIYQTIRGLGKPISPEVREVFDRMLALEPERSTVIGGEHEYGPSIDHIHAADAAEIKAPHEAGPAADRVAAEKQHVVETLPTEVRNELETKASEVQSAEGEHAGGETGAGPGGPREVEQGGGAARSESGSGTGGGESRAVVSGGSEAASNGATGKSGAGSGPESNPLASTPAPHFGESDSPFLDKAGNIRRDVLNTTEDIWQAIKAKAEGAGDFMGARRGVITDGHLVNLADAIGRSGAMDLVRGWAKGRAFNAEEITALTDLLLDTAADANKAMKAAAIGTDADVLKFAELSERHLLVQQALSGGTAEAGRALHAFKAFKERSADAAAMGGIAEQTTGKTLFQLRMIAKMGAGLDTPGKVAKFLANSQKRSFGRMTLEYWINGLISGPATHATYMVGNTLLSLQKAGPETGAAAAIGHIRALMGREGERMRYGEVPAQLMAGIRGLPAAVQAATEAARSGVTTLLPGEKARPMMPFNEYEGLVVGKNATNDQVAWREAGADLFGLARGTIDGVLAAGELLKAGGERGAPMVGLNYSPLGQIPDIAVKGVTVLPIGQIARLPSRGVAVIHSFFRSLLYSMDKAGDAYRTATNEGHTGAAFESRIADIRQNPTEEQMERYRTKATELALMGPGGEFTKYLSRLTNSSVNLPFLGETQLLKFIDPFVHISSNVIEQAILQRTPVGILSSEIRADLAGKNGNVAQDTAMARMMVGTAYAVAFGSLAAHGYISGSGPSDRNQAAMWRAAGNQAHSVRIGDIWYDAHRLGPMGMLLGISADMYEVAHLIGKDEYLKAASAFHHAITQNVLDESFMRGPADLIKALEDPGRYGGGYVRNFLGSFVPMSVGMAQIARANDPYSRQARSMMDTIKTKVPGLSEEVLPRIDIWGQPVPNKDVLGIPGVSAIYEQKVSMDPVNIAMVKLGIGPAPVQRKIRGVDLTDNQWDEYARMSGRLTKMRLDVIVNAPAFQRWPVGAQHDVIQETIRQSREIARGALMAKYPDIIRKAAAAKAKGFDQKEPD